MKSRHAFQRNFHLTSNNSNLFRIAIVVILILTLFETALLSINSNIEGNLDSGVTPVKSNPAPLWNGQTPYLPNNKGETLQYEKMYPSLFNFDTVRNLNQAYDKGADPKLLNASQLPQPTLTPALPAANPQGNPPIHLNGICGAVGAPDAFDSPVRDNNPANPDQRSLAKAILPATNQIHNLEITTDVDWVYFDAIVGRTYTIRSEPNAIDVDTAIQLFDSSGDINTSSGLLIAANNDSIAPTTGTPGTPGIDIINFTPTTAGRYYVRVIFGTQPADNLCGGYTLSLAVTAATAAPTATATSSITPTFGPCTDAYEPDFNPANAKLLKISQSTTPSFGPTPGLPTIDTANDGTQQHYSCPAGDIDWVYFDLVKGKAYTIFTSNLKGGIDTFFVIYTVNPDGSLKPTYSSDDYPGAGLASRVDWIVPTTTNTPLGEFVRYYVAVKDVAGHGGDNMSYNLTLASQGNGLGNCFDVYEPDNYATQAKEILLNEVQLHIFCPDGDTDWVKFFAKAGRVYTMYTNFTNLNNTGLDTSLFVWAVQIDPNDPTKVISQISLGQNDDKGDNDLSSNVSFRVPSDGVYYAEVRNAGSVGRDGMSYRLGFSAAGGPSATSAPATTAAATTTEAVTTSSTNSVTALGLTFGDPGFRRVWEYADLPILSGKVTRSWLWGPPGVAKIESYVDAPGNSRQVQYFDKSRMEINNPKANRNSQWFISNGLLVKEMILGQLATGDNETATVNPPQIPVAGDVSGNNPAPTYGSFTNIITVDGVGKSTDQNGKIVKALLKRDGSLSDLAKVPTNVKLVKFVPETGHNIPDVFWNYISQSGLVFDGNNYVQAPLMDWVYVMGLPLSEPVWTRAIVGGVEKDVMVQVFERRILTYTPSNTPQWQVEMGNVGQHYYQWRYGEALLNP